MKMPLKVGLPLLGLVLLGSGLTEGFEKTALLVVAMGVALWTAFSLPHPDTHTQPDPEGTDPEEAGELDWNGEEDSEEAPGRRRENDKSA